MYPGSLIEMAAHGAVNFPQWDSCVAPRDRPGAASGCEIYGLVLWTRRLAWSAVPPGPHRTRQRCAGPVCDRPSASRPVLSRQSRLQRCLEAVLTGRSGPGRALMVANRAETALTGAVRTGRDIAARIKAVLYWDVGFAYLYELDILDEIYITE